MAGLFGAALPMESIPVVPNGVALADFLKLGQETRAVLAAAELDRAWQAGVLFLLLPARITRRKNIELGLRVAAELKRQGQAVRLVVTGPPGPHNPKNDEYVRELLALRTALEVEEEVVFLMERWQEQDGRPRTLPDEVIADLYRCADALFFPSTQEGFGIPILEAGLVRLPIFCTRLQPFVEVAGDTPYYFDPQDDPADIAELIRERLAQNVQYELRRRVIENYTWEGVFEKQIKPLVEG
jgi:mannosylglucosylglycerate synthase